MLTLYHLRISHFCEKARWALDYKGLEYTSRLLTPGFHIATARRLAGTRSVPILVDSDSDQVIPDSTEILHYLDHIRPDPPLFPRDAVAATTVAEVEDVLDSEWAPNASAFAYCCMIQSPEELRQRWAEGLRWHQRLALGLAMPLLVPAMRRGRRLTPDMMPGYREAALAALGRINERLATGETEFLVGNEFTAADLAAGALIAPFLNIPGSPWATEGTVPEQMSTFREEVVDSAAGRHAAAIWAAHRH